MRQGSTVTRMITIFLILMLALPVQALAAGDPDTEDGRTAEQTEPAMNDQVPEQTAEPAQPAVVFDDSMYRSLSSRVIKPKKKLRINLRKMIGENSSGYSIVQGGCAGGKYAYYLMVSSETQKGRVLKVRIKNNKVVKRSKVLNTWHGNGMAYDSKRKKLVVISREHRKQEITVIDAKTLKIVRQQNVQYNNYIGAGPDSLSEWDQEQGLAAVAYVRKYDCYIALERISHNLLIFDPDTLEAIGTVYTRINEKYPGTFQAIDADEKYVYLLLSYYNKEDRLQPYNLILALDWNGENLKPTFGTGPEGGRGYVEKMWSCNNDGSGRPDAVIRIKTRYEAENIYHIKDKLGREHFYLSEYYGHWAKKKKIWYFRRDGYVYDLGIL